MQNLVKYAINNVINLHRNVLYLYLLTTKSHEISFQACTPLHFAKNVEMYGFAYCYRLRTYFFIILINKAIYSLCRVNQYVECICHYFLVRQKPGDIMPLLRSITRI